MDNKSKSSSFFGRLKSVLNKNEPEPEFIDEPIEENAYGVFGISYLMKDLEALIAKTPKEAYDNIILLLLLVKYPKKELFYSYEDKTIRFIKEAILPIEKLYIVESMGMYGVIVYGSSKLADIICEKIKKNLKIGNLSGELGSEQIKLDFCSIHHTEDTESSIDLIFSARKMLEAI